jgi:hypothetical protein
MLDGLMLDWIKAPTKRPVARPLIELIQETYFGVAVVSLVFFLLFLPPL